MIYIKIPINLEGNIDAFDPSFCYPYKRVPGHHKYHRTTIIPRVEIAVCDTSILDSPLNSPIDI